jgi:Protein of unknown function (DUF4238)
MSLEKQRHHYVPQFWMRRFRDATNSLYQWNGRRCDIASTKNIMQEAWLNTTFDAQWQASNQLEDNLAQLEHLAARLFGELEDLSVVLTEQHREMLCDFLALQACRHPDVFNSGHRKVARLATFFADAPFVSTEAQFTSEAAKLGIGTSDAAAIYGILCHADPDSLEKQALEAMTKSPQNPELPITDALKAMVPVSAALMNLSYEVITAPSGVYFVLGDTPLPQSNLGLGFVVPLSKDVGVVASPASAPAVPTISRRAASAQEVADSNRTQWQMAAKLVVGPDQAPLAALGPP